MVEHYEPAEISPKNLYKRSLRYEVRGGCYILLDIEDVLLSSKECLFTLGVYGSGPELTELDAILASADIGRKMTHLGDAQSLYQLQNRSVKKKRS